MSAAPRSKIIVRNFPPGYTDGQFRELVTPWMEAADYIHFDPGKKPKPLSTKPVIFGRGYLNFKDSGSLLEACQRLSGTHLVDLDGFEGVLEVALAPYQGIPGPSQPDPLQGTIESTPEWSSFLADLDAASNPTAIPIDKQAELMLAKERELNPWKYEMGLAKQTPLLVHLKKQAAGGISVKGLLSTTGGGKANKNGKSKKKKKKAAGKGDDGMLDLPQSTSTAPLAPAKAMGKANKNKPKASEDLYPSSLAKTMNSNANNDQPTQPIQQPAQKPKSKPKPKPKAKPAQSAVDPVPQAPVAPLKIMMRPADANSPVQPKVVSTKPSSKPTVPAAAGNTTTYNSASKTVYQYSSKASQSQNNKAKTTPRPAE